jgi:hypothetical protein
VTAARVFPSGGATARQDSVVAGSVVSSVQANCDLADALHARDKSLCIYLLGMREYFRWVSDLPLGAAPDRARLSEWISRREAEWDAMRERCPAYAALPLAGGIDPFDEDAANRELRTHGLVYGAGLGLFGAPLFFLARRDSEQLRDGVRVIVTGAELARGVTASPAVSRGGTIVIRTDALRRWLWTRAETTRRARPSTAFARALFAYGADVADAVDRMTQGETETLVLHELGELRAGELLGTEWEDMLLALHDRRTEVILRAVRDLLADCLVTLPNLTARGATRSLLFWIANFEGMRRALAPELADSCGADSARIDLAALERAATDGQQRWRDLAFGLLAAWRRGGADAVCHESGRLAAGH